MLDLDELLQSFGEDAPSGEDLTYDSAYSALELASQLGEEKVVGDSVVLAEEPDYADIIGKAGELLTLTRDLRVAVIMANAALRAEGFPAFEEILAYMRGCLELYWDSVHPQLDAEDDDDPTMRVNAVLGLADRQTVLASLRLAPLTDSRAFGRISLRDILIAAGESEPPADMENVPTDQVVSAAFQDTPPETLASLAEAVARSLDHVKAIGAIFDEKVGSLGPDLSPLQKTLFDIGRQLADHVQIESAAESDSAGADADIPEAGTAAGATGTAGAAPSGAITSREDVKKALDRINDYYARCEPSSPVPLLLTRARRLVAADFVTIMRDMAPSGVESIARIGGFSTDDMDDLDEND